MRKKISSGSPWEEIVGYSRAVRVGNIIEVAGTTAMDGDILIGKGDVYAQTVFIFKKLEKALQEAGAGLADVVRTRMFITDISKITKRALQKNTGSFFRFFNRNRATIISKFRLYMEQLRFLLFK